MASLSTSIDRISWWWRVFTLRGFEAEPSPLRKRQIHLFWTFSAIAAVVFTAFSADHFLSSYGNVLVGEAYLLAAALTLLNLVGLKLARRFTMARIVFFLILIATLEVLLTTGGILQAGILWFFIYPPIAFFLTSRRNGLRLIAALYVVTVGLFVADLFGYLDIPYATLTLRQFGLSFLMVSLLIYFQERGRERDELLIVQSEADLRRSFERLQAEAEERERAERQLAGRTKKLESTNRSLESTKQAMANLLEDLKEAKGEVERKNDLIRLQQTIAVAANNAESAAEAMAVAVREICNFAKRPVGHIFRVDEDGTIRSSGIWYLQQPRHYAPLKAVTEKHAFGSHDGLPGKTLGSGKPVWVNEAKSWRQDQIRKKVFQKLGIKHAAAFPIFAGQRVAAIVELFDERAEPRNEALVDTLSSIGTILGRAIEREEAARDREQLATVVRSSADAIISKTLDGKIVSWNRAAEKLYGYRAREVVGKSISLLIPPSRPNELEGILEKVRQGEEIDNYDSIRVAKDGRLVDVSLSISPIRDAHNKIIGASAISRDVTQQKRVDQMKTDFVSLVSHQLKTPVGQIRGYLENMLNGVTGALTDKQREYVTGMLSISVENYALINELLNVSRLERGIVPIDLTKTNLQDIVEHALRDYREAIDRKGLKLKVTGAKPPLVVRADRGKFEEALRNTINNAVKFTRRGTISVKLSAKGPVGLVEVSDDGPGIPANIRDRLFTRTQILAGQPNAGGGAGLGLYIAKSFMNLQHGDVAVKPRRGKGTTFVFSIPLVPRSMKKQSTLKKVKTK